MQTQSDAAVVCMPDITEKALLCIHVKNDLLYKLFEYF